VTLTADPRVAGGEHRCRAAAYRPPWPAHHAPARNNRRPRATLRPVRDYRPLQPVRQPDRTRGHPGPGLPPQPSPARRQTARCGAVRCGGSVTSRTASRVSACRNPNSPAVTVSSRSPAHRSSARATSSGPMPGHLSEQPPVEMTAASCGGLQQQPLLTGQGGKPRPHALPERTRQPRSGKHLLHRERHPPAAGPMAVALPIPPVPPVTRTVLPAIGPVVMPAIAESLTPRTAGSSSAGGLLAASDQLLLHVIGCQGGTRAPARGGRGSRRSPAGSSPRTCIGTRSW
jgi:hypothetical protein